MIARCANPDCNSTFRMWEGKVYHFDRRALDTDGSTKLITDYYWLCGDCAPSFVLELAEEGLVLKTVEISAADQPELATV